MNNDNNRTPKTHLNKNFRAPWGINSRCGINGHPLAVSKTVVTKRDGTYKIHTKYLDRDTENGGNVTPFNIQPLSEASCGITKIIQSENTTTVIFADGDRVVLSLHAGEVYDLHTAILWALGQKVFGTDLARQITKAIKYRVVDTKALHQKKSDAKIAQM